MCLLEPPQRVGNARSIYPRSQAKCIHDTRYEVGVWTGLCNTQLDRVNFQPPEKVGGTFERRPQLFDDVDNSIECMNIEAPSDIQCIVCSFTCKCLEKSKYGTNLGIRSNKAESKKANFGGFESTSGKLHVREVR
jgi:hypothetical protein